MILSTSGSADGSQTAKVIDAAVRKCTHDRESQGRDLIGEATALLATADKCLEAAEHLRASSGHRELLDDFINQSIESSAEAESMLDRALAEELAAEKEVAAATSAATNAGVSIDLGVEGLARQAEGDAGSAKRLLRDDDSRGARLLKGRCAAVRAAALQLLDRL
jgi:hypothetical protein